MGDALRKLVLAVGTLALAVPVLAADPITLEVRDAGNQPIVGVTVGEVLDPKGVHYDVSTTLGAGAEARTFHLGFTRKGNQWVVDSLDGLKGGPFKKLTSIASKAGAAANKHFKGLAKLAETPEERSALLLQGKQLQAEIKARAAETVAAVNATATFDLMDLALAQASAALRYYDRLYATLDAVAAFGPKDKKNVSQHMNDALVELYPIGNAGQCVVPMVPKKPPVYRMNSTDCPPSDFVPLSTTPLSQECYGKKGLYQDQDFICSAGAPQGVTLYIDGAGFPVDFRECCLEHDRAFFCGGVSPAGLPTGGPPGSFDAWERANATLVSCVSEALKDGYAAASTVPNDAVVGGWEFYFSWTGNIFIWGNAFLIGDAWTDPAVLQRRLDTCICGGDQPVPLCESHCKVNQCTESLPAMIDKDAFLDFCDNTCIWTCVEEYEDGKLTKRYKRKRLFDAHGNVIDTGADFDFSNCTPTYEMPCACEPYERPNPPGEAQCLIPNGYFTSLGLPTAQIVTQVNP